MKKLFVSLCLLLALSMTLVNAQSLSKAEASYAQFNKLRASGGSEASIYDALYHSYTDYIDVLNGSEHNSPEYNAAKRALREMIPYLQMGAAWSSNNKHTANAILFAQAYIDIHLLPAFKNDMFVKDENYAKMAFFAASGTFNTGQYEKSLTYFRAYLETGEQKDRETIYKYMAKACMEIKDYNMAMDVINEAINYFPNNYSLLSMAINSCLERSDYANLLGFVEKAIKIKPNDPQLLNIQGLMYENLQDFQKALSVYNKLDKIKPNNLGISKHIALNYYNLGVTFYNKALMEQNEAVAKRQNRQANEYFSASAPVLENVVANDPKATAYIEALAIAYNCIDDKANLDIVNSKLSSYGIAEVGENAIPELLVYDSSAPVPGPGPDPQPRPAQDEVQRYSVFAKNYVEDRISKWQKKSEFETIDEYRARVTEESREVKKNELLKQAEQEYIAKYTKNIKFNDLVLKQYDADNNSYLVESRYGNLIVPVPRKNNEAQVFKSSWSGMQFKDPSFYISNDQLLLSSLKFVTPSGNTYVYDNRNELAYNETLVDIQFEPIVIDPVNTQPQPTPRPNPTPSYLASDVDRNIPESKITNENTFAFIIANEQYDVVSKVDYAINDGKIFAEYCKKTLGMPKTHVKFYENATYGKMVQAISLIQNTAKFNPDANIIIYFAGHGIPNEETKDAYLLPVDADGKTTDGCYSQSRLYQELGELSARQVVVFLDACFSGATRDGGMLASVRGIAIDPKTGVAQGNMVVFSAATGNQTAQPWREKSHGLFTYFLLKKLQDSKGEVTLKELGDYIVENVSRTANNEIGKVQTPTIMASYVLGDSWQKRTLK